MAKIVHARLDDESQRLLKELRRSTGMKDSELLRQGLRALAARSRTGGKPRIVGVGKFASGHLDLGSNKERLRGFGTS